MVEQLSVKQWVVGSSPTICTNRCLVNGQVVYRVGTPDWKSEEVRSTRALPTNCCEAAPSVQDTWWRMKQDYWVGVGVSAVLWTRTLGFYAIHKPTRRNPKEKHTNSANGMWGGMEVPFHIFLKHMEQKTISMRSFLHQGCKSTAFLSHSLYNLIFVGVLVVQLSV